MKLQDMLNIVLKVGAERLIADRIPPFTSFIGRENAIASYELGCSEQGHKLFRNIEAKKKEAWRNQWGGIQHGMES